LWKGKRIGYEQRNVFACVKVLTVYIAGIMLLIAEISMGRAKKAPIKDSEEAKSDRNEDSVFGQVANPSAVDRASLSRNEGDPRGDIAADSVGDTENKDNDTSSDEEDDFNPWRPPPEEGKEQGVPTERARAANTVQESARRAERAERERQERFPGVHSRTNPVGIQVPGIQREVQGHRNPNLPERVVPEVQVSEDRPSYRYANVLAARRGGSRAGRPSRGGRGFPTEQISGNLGGRGREEVQVPEQVTRNTSRFFLRQRTEFRVTTAHQRTTIRAVRQEIVRGESPVYRRGSAHPVRSLIQCQKCLIISVDSQNNCRFVRIDISQGLS
jgi:hypothetical protein